MLSARGLTLQRGAKPLFRDGVFTVHPGQKVGLVGANGSGKSSLLALLLGELQADAGELDYPPQWVVAHVAQETKPCRASALDYVLDGDTELRRIERAIAAESAADTRADGLALARLHAEFDAIDGYRAAARAARLLAGLGFDDADQQRPVAHFSGGWRMRLNLAQALMCRSDLLLLDEPTNHLDLDAVLWLEQWLRGYPGALLLISHDRDFLDAVVGSVICIEQARLHSYSGNYSDFEQTRAERLRQQQAAHLRQRSEMVRLTRFIDRFRAKASKARQAQSRLKALNRLERIDAAQIDSPFRFRFRPAAKYPQPTLSLRAAGAGYADKMVLNRVTLSLRPGSRIGLLGRNGAGKSTLIKLLAGQLAPTVGERLPAQDCRVGYFAQHQLELLRPDRSPLQHLLDVDALTQEDGSPAGEQALRDYLGGFDFVGDRALEPVAPLSGGEKARLVLALLIWQRPNLLLLDEPTNHLDLNMRHALNVALQDYQGALVLVSHDRHLLRTVSDELWLVSAGRVEPFAGDLDDYRNWLNRQTAGSPDRGSPDRGSPDRGSPDRGSPDRGSPDRDAATIAPPSARQRREQKRHQAELRNRLAALQKPLKKQLHDVERQLAELNAAKTELTATLADPALYQDDNKKTLKQRLLRQGEIDRRLTQLENRWFELQESLEAVTSGAAAAE